uniref:Sialin n=1 Tax=Romanomermis culicivorax TaxID=13658 RepID=A0A915KLK4_ROMCU
STNNNSEDLNDSGPQHYFNRFSFFTNFPRRYYLVILAFLGFFNLYAMRVNFSVAILYMTTNRTIVYPDGSSTFNRIPSQFSDVAHSRGIVLSAFFYGYILTQLPGVEIYFYLGCQFGSVVALPLKLV